MTRIDQSAQVITLTRWFGTQLAGMSEGPKAVCAYRWDDACLANDRVLPIPKPFITDRRVMEAGGSWTISIGSIDGAQIAPMTLAETFGALLANDNSVASQSNNDGDSNITVQANMPHSGIHLLCFALPTDSDHLAALIEDVILLCEANPGRVLIKPFCPSNQQDRLVLSSRNSGLTPKEQKIMDLLTQGRLRLQPERIVQDISGQPRAELLAKFQLADGSILSAGAALDQCAHPAVFLALDIAVLEYLSDLPDALLEEDFSINVDRDCLVEAAWMNRLHQLLDHRPSLKNCLTLEITERGKARDIGHLIGPIKALQRLGVKLMFDDFGRGVSTMNELVACPVDGLKFDQSMIQHATKNDTANKLLRSLIGFAGVNNLTTVAEGIETEAQYEQAQLLGFDGFQGYYFGKPSEAALI